jgi:hypothetical protein
LNCPSFFELRLLITRLVSSNLSCFANYFIWYIKYYINIVNKYTWKSFPYFVRYYYKADFISIL